MFFPSPTFPYLLKNKNARLPAFNSTQNTTRENIVYFFKIKKLWNKNLELNSLERLSELPICRDNVVASHPPTITGADLDWKTLSIEVGIALPVLAPVPWHRLPRWRSLGPLDRHRMHVSGASYICYQHQVEVRVAVDGKPYSSFPHTCHPVLTKHKVCKMGLAQISQM